MDFFKEQYSKKIDIYYQDQVEDKILKEGVKVLKGDVTEVDNLNLIKNAKGRQVFRLDIEGEGYYLKKYCYRRYDKKIKNIFRSSEAIRAYDIAHELLQAGIEVVEPTVAINYHKSLMTKDSLFITKEFAGSNLQEYLANGNYTQELKDKIIIKLAKLWAKIYKANFLTGDPNLPGILVQVKDKNVKLCLVDMDNFKRYNFLSWKKIIKNLIKFNAHTYSGLDKIGNKKLNCEDRSLFLKEFIKAYGKKVDINKLMNHIGQKTADRLIEWEKKDLVLKNDNLEYKN
ncbi:lipopolysaccharide kinase InaA family protein [Halanaerobaculum tunisiense]